MPELKPLQTTVDSMRLTAFGSVVLALLVTGTTADTQSKATVDANGATSAPVCASAVLRGAGLSCRVAVRHLLDPTPHLCAAAA